MFNSSWFQRNGRLRVCWGERIVIGPDTNFFAASIFFLTTGWLLFVLYTNVIETVRVLTFIFGALSLSLLLATGLCNPGICPRHNYICNTEHVELREQNEVEMQSNKERKGNSSVLASPFTTETSLGAHSDNTFAQKAEHGIAQDVLHTSNLNGNSNNNNNNNSNNNNNEYNVIHVNEHNRIDNSNVISNQISNIGLYDIDKKQKQKKEEKSGEHLIDGNENNGQTVCNPNSERNRDVEDLKESRMVKYHMVENNEEMHEPTTSSLLLPSNSEHQVNDNNMHCSNQVCQGIRCIETFVNDNNMASKCNSLIPNRITNNNVTNAATSVNYNGTNTTTAVVVDSNNTANSNCSINDNKNKNEININENERRSNVPFQHDNSRWWRVVFRAWNGSLQHASVEQRWCYSCNSYRPLRAVHCRFCDVCIHRWDHHCPWTGTCIGGRNYVWYFSLLWVLLFFLIIAFFGGVVSLASRIVKLRQTHSADLSNSFTYDVINGLLETYLIELVLILLSLVWLTLVGTLACYHTYLITKNLTSSEDAKRLTENIHNQGSIWRNIYHSLCYKEQNDDLLSQSTATSVSLSTTSCTHQPSQSVHSSNVNIDNGNNNNNNNNYVNPNVYATNTIVVEPKTVIVQ